MAALYSSSMELETAVRLQLNVVQTWSGSMADYNMVAVQEEAKYKRTAGVDFGPVDVVKYAEAFGARGLMIESPEQIAPMLRQAFETAGPVR